MADLRDWRGRRLSRGQDHRRGQVRPATRVIRPALDSNVLIYGFLEPDSEKGQLANELIARAAAIGVLAVQAIGEFLWVVLGGGPNGSSGPRAQPSAFVGCLTPVGTDLDLVLAASRLVRRHGSSSGTP